MFQMHFDGELMTPEIRPPPFTKGAQAHYLTPMCGRITQRSGELPGLVTVMSGGRDSRIKTPPRYNGAPGPDIGDGGNSHS